MASFDGYLCLGGTEIINKGRLSQMIGSGRGPEGVICHDCAPCPDLDTALGYPLGYNPADNPWYSPDEPDSDQFAGLLVTSITGLEPGAFSRVITENAGVGAVLGQGRQSAPQIVVTGILMARTCAAMDYGYRWLRKAVKGSCGPGQPCVGDDLVYIVAEPQFSDEDCGPVDFPAELIPYLRTFKGAAIVSGPTITQVVPRGCPSCYECGMLEVQFTLSASDPCVYREPLVILETGPFSCATATDCIVWVDDADGTGDCSDDCPQGPPCATDPNCVDISPPMMPALINPCVPDCISGVDCTASVLIPDGTFPPSASGTVIINVFAGDEAMRNIRIKVWENPLGLPLSELEDCAVCATLAISYIAPQSTLVIDGAGRSASITCPGGSPVRANPFIASAGSATFAYPEFICGTDYTLAVTVNGPVSSLAAVEILAIAREC